MLSRPHSLLLFVARGLAAFLLSPLLVAPAQPTAPAPSQNSAPLQAVLTRLDAANVHFTSAQASFHKDLYNALVKETTPQDGTIYFLRQKSGATQMGAKIDGIGPRKEGARVVEYKDTTLRDYNPRLKCYDTVSASGNQSKIESFLTLGFGGSGKDLSKAWEITDQGSETLQEDGKPVKVEKLDLLPREQSVKGLVTHVTLWLDLDRGVSLKQEFFSPSGDTQTAFYNKIRTKGKIDIKPFKIEGSPCGK